jgi:hypothetical protein
LKYLDALERGYGGRAKVVLSGHGYSLRLEACNMTSAPESILRVCELPGSGFTVMLEDDGRVAYAYLKGDGAIVADVWLYNVAATPCDEDAWRDPTQLPFLNPRRYCRSNPMPRITDQSRISCAMGFEFVEVSIDGELIARLEPGRKPGWSKLAAIEGPLALPLDSTRPRGE